MKSLIATALIALSFAAPTHAADICPAIGELASATMEARQIGVPLSQSIEIAGTSEVARSIALDAYKQPRYSTDEYRTKAAQDFRNKWELICYNATAKGKNSV